MRKILVCLLPLTIGICGCSAVSTRSTVNTPAATETTKADFPSYSTVGELTQKSSLVIQGRISPQSNPGFVAERSQNAQTVGNSDMPQTVYQVEVTKGYKCSGTCPDHVSVGVLGGKRPDGSLLVVDEIRQLQPGEEYVLFLKDFSSDFNNADIPLAIAGGSQGQFKVTAQGFKQDLNHPTLQLTQADLDRIHNR